MSGVSENAGHKNASHGSAVIRSGPVVQISMACMAGVTVAYKIFNNKHQRTSQTSDTLQVVHGVP